MDKVQKAVGSQNPTSYSVKLLLSFYLKDCVKICMFLNIENLRVSPVTLGGLSKVWGGWERMTCMREMTNGYKIFV
jgi:hypothetical protein